LIVPSEMPEALLDTDTLSLYRRAHAQVSRHAAAYIRRYSQLTYTELTRYEILRGLIAAQASRQLMAFESFCRLHRILLP
jgi:tRNA(fMet)-specific endonuclease VapC